MCLCMYLYIFTYGHIFMFNHYACINGCNVCIYIFMDVMFKCRPIYACMYVYMLLQI